LQREGRTNEINTHDWLGIRKALTTYRAVHGGQAMKDTPWLWLWLPVALWSFGVLGAIFYGAAARFGWIEYIIGACN